MRVGARFSFSVVFLILFAGFVHAAPKVVPADANPQSNSHVHTANPTLIADESTDHWSSSSSRLSFGSCQNSQASNVVRSFSNEAIFLTLDSRSSTDATLTTILTNLVFAFQGQNPIPPSSVSNYFAFFKVTSSERKLLRYGVDYQIFGSTSSSMRSVPTSEFPDLPNAMTVFFWLAIEDPVTCSNCKFELLLTDPSNASSSTSVCTENIQLRSTYVEAVVRSLIDLNGVISGNPGDNDGNNRPGDSSPPVETLINPVGAGNEPTTGFPFASSLSGGGCVLRMEDEISPSLFILSLTAISFLLISRRRLSKTRSGRAAN